MSGVDAIALTAMALIIVMVTAAGMATLLHWLLGGFDE